jgi:hypothetical protein
MAKFGKGGLGAKFGGAKFGGGDPAVKKMAKEKTIGKISGDTVSSPRMDRCKRASGGAVMAPAAAKNPMACAAKGGKS